MIIGVPKEVKIGENRVGVVPAGVQALVDAGNRVLVETGAGEGSGIPDAAYRAAGAEIVPDAAATWGGADMVVKVKEPIAAEYGLLRPGLVLFTYLHLAAARELTVALVERGVTAIAYETVEAADGSLPLLAPMSEVAGRLATQIGATLLQKDRGGPGILLGGVPGVRHGRVTVLGGGAVGVNAARVAVGMGAEVTLIDIDLKRLAMIDEHFQGKVETLMSNRATIEEAAIASDLLVGGVLVAGRAGAGAGLGGDGAPDAGGLRDRRRGGRPGRLRRDDPPDDPRRPDLCPSRGDPLRRDQHAGARAADVDVRADERDAPVSCCGSPGASMPRSPRTPASRRD